MLVDKNYPDIFPLCGEPLKRRLDGGVVRLCIYYQKVLLVVWRRRDMLSMGRVRLKTGSGWGGDSGTYADTSEKKTSDGILLLGEQLG